MLSLLVRAVRRRARAAAARRQAVAFIGGLLCAASAAPAGAVEIAPFLGQRYGGLFEDGVTGTTFEVADAKSYGLILDFDLEPDKQIEVYVSRQDTHLAANGAFTGDPLFDLTIDYYHIGGLYLLEGDKVRPFVSGSFGLTRMDPHGAGLTTENRFSLALGTGVKLFLTENLGLRFDARGLYTALNADAAIFCSGGCAVRVSSSGFFQFELGAALMLRF
jgi:hypothetical protein